MNRKIFLTSTILLGGLLVVGFLVSTWKAEPVGALSPESAPKRKATKPGTRDAGKINWSESMEKALARGLAEGKPVFVGGSSREYGDAASGDYCRGFRMLNLRILQDDEIVRIINEETIPVRMDITDQGFPVGIEALRRWEAFLNKSPWPRLGFGHWFLLSPDGKHVFKTGSNKLHMVPNGTSLYPRDKVLRRLRNGVDRFQRYQSLKASDRKKDLPVLGKLLETVDAEANAYYDSAADTIALTIRYVNDRGVMPLRPIVDTILRTGGNADRRVAPGFRQAVMRNLGDLLTVRHRHNEVTRRWIAGFFGMEPEASLDKIYESSFWKITERNAARALARLAVIDMDPADPNFVNKVKSWWKENQDQEEYQISWSDNPLEKYSFTL